MSELDDLDYGEIGALEDERPMSERQIRENMTKTKEWVDREEAIKRITRMLVELIGTDEGSSYALVKKEVSGLYHHILTSQRNELKEWVKDKKKHPTINCDGYKRACEDFKNKLEEMK